MKPFSILRPRFIAMSGLALILGVSSYGFAASNSVPAQSAAGDGRGTISGYTITNVTYTQDNAGNITNASFRVAPTQSTAGQAKTVSVKLISTATTYQSCTLSNVTDAGGAIIAKDASCAISGVTAEAADELRVIANQ